MSIKPTDPEARFLWRAGDIQITPPEESEEPPPELPKR